MLHEEGQQVEDLGFQVDELGAAAQFAALDVEPVVAKRQHHARSPEASRPASLPNPKASVRQKMPAAKHLPAFEAQV